MSDRPWPTCASFEEAVETLRRVAAETVVTMAELIRKPVDHRRYRSFEYEGVAYNAAYTIIQAAPGRRLHALSLYQTTEQPIDPVAAREMAEAFLGPEVFDLSDALNAVASPGLASGPKFGRLELGPPQSA